MFKKAASRLLNLNFQMLVEAQRKSRLLGQRGIGISARRCFIKSCSDFIQAKLFQMVLSVHERIPTAYRENKGSGPSSLKKRGKQLLLP